MTGAPDSYPAPGPAAAPSARAVRAEIRQWRRGRAELSWGEVVSDAYVVLFSAVVLGAMAGNVLLSLQDVFVAGCDSRCEQVRGTLGWLSVLGSAVVVLGLCRLLGPVFVPPAASAWVLATPVDRAAWLRPALLRALALAGLLGGLVALPLSLFAADDIPGAARWTLAAALVGVGLAGLAGVAQIRQTRHASATWWGLVGVCWALLVAAVLGQAPPVASGLGWSVGGPALAVAFALAAIGMAAGLRALPATLRRVLAVTQRLFSSLSGALASLDLGLLYDVLLDRRWNTAAVVRSRPGRGRGAAALVHREWRRLVRSPQPVVVLAALLLIPYAVSSAGAGRGAAAVAALTLFAGTLPLASGLRVMARGQTLARMLPLRRRPLLLAHLVVPGAVTLIWSLAATPAIADAWPSQWGWLAGGAVWLSGLAAATRWLTGQPPDYGRPLVTTPAGAVPTGLLGSMVRGFDIWLLTCLPLLMFAGWWGPAISIGLSLITLHAVTAEPEEWMR